MERITKQFNPPLCEVCLKEPATSFSFIDERNRIKLPVGWVFSGDCTCDHESYYIMFDQFFISPQETQDWLEHLQGKSWFVLGDFVEMMARFYIALGKKRKKGGK